MCVLSERDEIKIETEANFFLLMVKGIYRIYAYVFDIKSVVDCERLYLVRNFGGKIQFRFYF